MGKVEEFFDRARWLDFLDGKRDTPFSRQDFEYAKQMGIDVNQSPTPVQDQKESSK